MTYSLRVETLFFYIFESRPTRKVNAKNAFTDTKHMHHSEPALFTLKNSLPKIKFVKISHRLLKINIQIHLNY